MLSTAARTVVLKVYQASWRALFTGKKETERWDHKIVAKLWSKKVLFFAPVPCPRPIFGSRTTLLGFRPLSSLSADAYCLGELIFRSFRTTSRWALAERCWSSKLHSYLVRESGYLLIFSLILYHIYIYTHYDDYDYTYYDYYCLKKHLRRNSHIFSDPKPGWWPKLQKTQSLPAPIQVASAAGNRAPGDHWWPLVTRVVSATLLEIYG